ncbi:MAG: phage tail sheath family protein [Bradymonadales bacterium]|nr:phage tail sheath family protein [Bradymonadales bacterium]
MVGRNVRIPGVYFERRERRERALALGESGIPVLMGLASRGPLDVPVKVFSYDEYHKLFGAPVPGTFLNDAVYGFFKNGGRFCYIIRVAHKRGGATEEVAARASYQVLDSQGRPTMLIEAANEGVWGNQIQIEVRDPQDKPKTYITFDLEANQTKMTVKSARGFERGSMVRLFNRKQEHYGVLAEVQSKMLRLRDSDVVRETFKSSDLTYIEPVEFEIFVKEGAKLEHYQALSMAVGSENYPERVINDASQLIRVQILDNEGTLAERIPKPVGPVSLEGGLDGLQVITPEDFIGINEGPDQRFGLRALEANEEIDLIALPDLMACHMLGLGFQNRRDIEAVQEAVCNHCELLKDRFAILDIPPGMNAEQALSWRLQFDSDFAAFYYPWIGIPSAEGYRIIPPCGHIAGVYSRCDREGGPHRAAANEVIQGAVALDVMLEEEEIGYMNSQGVNGLRLLPQRGIRIWGARTVSSRKEWRYVPVRRSFNMIRRAIFQGSQWVVFENNEPELWQKLERQIKYFLNGLFERGFFAGEAPDQAFYVRCNSETNPAERREAGELVAEIGIAPVRPAEFLTFVLEQQLSAE